MPRLYTCTRNQPRCTKGLNGALGGWGDGGVAAIKHYEHYLKLLLTACQKLPTYSGRLFQGVCLPPSVVLGNKVVGDVLELQAVTSASKTSDVLRSAQFLGIGGKGAPQNIGGRVVLQYAALSAVEINRFDALGQALASDDFVNEDEVLLLPGARFKIDSIKTWEYSGVVEVQLHQLPPAIKPNVNDIDAGAGVGVGAGVGAGVGVESSIADPLGTYSRAAPLYENIDTYMAPGDRAANTTLPPFIYNEAQGTVLSMNPASYANTHASAADAQSPEYAVCADDAGDFTMRPSNGAASAANRLSVYDVTSVAGNDVDVLVAGGGAALYSIPLDTGNDFATYDRVRSGTVRVGTSSGSSIYSVPVEEQAFVASEA